MIGDCKLCGAHSVKLSRSHIIPKSFYGELLFQENGPAKVVSTERGIYPQKIPGGVYDPDMLCMDCEDLTASWDDYAYKILHEREADQCLKYEGAILARLFHDYNYSLVALFFLSLLWRMHHSKNRLFNQVNLGLKYETKIRAALVAQRPELVPEFDMILYSLEDKSISGITGPQRVRFGGVNTYAVSFAKYACRIKLDRVPFPPGTRSVSSLGADQLQILNIKYQDSAEFRAMKAAVERTRKWGNPFPQSKRKKN